MKFQKAEFWIQIYNITLMCMTKKVAIQLAENIGEMVEVPLEPKDCWGKYLRVKVRIDVSKPLKRGLRVWLSDFKMMVTVLLRYERLPDFCFACGLIGHGFQECSNKMARMEAMNNSSPKFGDWLRAPTPGRPSSRTQGRGNWRGKSSTQNGEEVSRGKQVKETSV
ncbi:hypothetical protein ACOSP7_014513 [Xanthoceras sorbifolium]